MEKKQTAENLEKAREIIYFLCQMPFLGPATMERMKKAAGTVLSLLKKNSGWNGKF